MTTSKVLECPCRCCTSLVGFNSQCLYSAWSFFVFCRHPKVTPRHSCSVVGACSVAGRFFSLGSLSTVVPPPPDTPPGFHGLQSTYRSVDFVYRSEPDSGEPDPVSRVSCCQAQCVPTNNHWMEDRKEKYLLVFHVPSL